MKKVVLIIDNEPRCYSQVRHTLALDNCDVFNTTSVEGAVKHFEVRTADLLLLNLDVPAQRIRSDLSQAAQLNPGVRIIGVTEGSQASKIQFHEHLDGVAEKPFALRSLIAFVRELLRNPPPAKAFRYVSRTMPGFRAGTWEHRPRVMDCPPVYSGWGINE